MSRARSTHGLLGYTPPPTTKFQLLPLVSRETCQRPQPCSIPAHTDVSVMTGEGRGANWNGGRLSGYGPARSDTRRFSSGAAIPGVGVLQANRCRHHRSDSDGSRSFIPAPALLPSATHHTERRVASARWRSPSSVPPAPRAGGQTPVTTPFGTVGEGLQRPQRFQYLPTKPDERAQHRWPPVSGASTPISRASGRSASPRYPSCPLIDRHAFRAAVMNRIAPRTAYHVDLAVSRETCSEPSH